MTRASDAAAPSAVASSEMPAPVAASSGVITNTYSPSMLMSRPCGIVPMSTLPGPPRASIDSMRWRARRARSSGEMPRNG